MKINFNRIFTFLFAGVLLITPLVMFHRTSEIFEFNKMLTIYLFTGIVTALWVARMIVHKQIILRKTALLLPLLIFVGTQVLSTIFSIDVQTSLFGYYGRFNGGLVSVIAYALLYMAFTSNIDISSWKAVRKAVEQIIKVSIIGSVLVILWGLPSRFGYDLTCLVFAGELNTDCWTAQFVPTIRTFSTLGQPNWLGAYLAVHIFFGLYFFLKHTLIEKYRTTVGAALYGVYIALAMIMLLYTRSRSALLAVGITGFLFGVYLLYRRTSFKLSSKKTALGSIVAAMVIPILIIGTGVKAVDRFIYIPSMLPEDQQSEQHKAEQEALAEPTLAQDVTGSGDIRKIVWQGAYNVGLESPYFGTGVETFAYSYNFLRPQQHNLTSEWNFVYNKAHNELYNYFATTGFIGTAAYLLFMALVLVHVRYLFTDSLKSKEKELLVASLLGGFITIIITNFLGFSTTTISLLYYIIPAMLVLVVYHSKLQKKEQQPVSAVAHIHKDDYFLMILPAGMLLVVLMFVSQYFRADLAYARGEQYRQTQQYAQALQEYYTAYNLRSEHEYADKMSQVLAQITLVKALTDGADMRCPDRNGTIEPCADLTRTYTKKILDQSPKNVYYFRTAARNGLILYQATQSIEDYEEALKAIQVARQLAPTDPRYPYLRSLFALAYYETLDRPNDDDQEELRIAGIGSATYAIELKENYPDAYYIRGLIYKELGKPQAARQDFEFILNNLNPDHSEAQKELDEL